LPRRRPDGASFQEVDALRLAIVSDIHGNLAALEAVAADIRRRGVERVVNLGDSVSGPLLPRETARCLMATDWLHLAGNHERQLLSLEPERMIASDAYAHAQLSAAELDWLRSLPPTARPAADIFLCHGTPSSDETYFLETVAEGTLRPASPAEIAERLRGESAALVACGHTHTPRILRTPQGLLLVNPGSVGLQAYDDVRPVYHKVETGSVDARYAIIEKHDGAWTAALISLPYDYKPMAVLAAAHGRPDWEHALLTGTMP
jgi:predicted phosphodiesterase